MDEEFEPPEDWDPEAAILRGLVAKREGEPVNIPEFELASVVLATKAFVQAGLDVDEAWEQVDKLILNGATIKASLDPDGRLEVSIEAEGIQL